MMLDVKRHKQVFDPNMFNMPLHVIGCGGMGSRVAEGLVRMGLGIESKSPIALYDHDSFALHNLTNQWVSVPHLLKKKVDAVRAQMVEINPQASVIIHPEAVDGPIPLGGVVFICLDTMEDRRVIIDDVLEDADRVRCVIETRMDAGVGISHCFNPNDPNQLACWRMYWHSDDEAENMRGCGGAQSIISAIYATTALALKQLEHFAKKKSTADMANRVYQDFDSYVIRSEQWPTA
jgi:molybdopterin/thiamine biosynthesis adenylyltransferase